MLRDDRVEPMLIADATSLQFQEVNQAAAAAYGYSKDELLTLHLGSLVPADDASRVLAWIRNERPDLQDIPGIHFTSKEGRVIETDLVIRWIRYNRSDALLLIPQDPARRKLLEEQLRQAQKMEAVALLAGGIAHDFNNLLTLINGYGQMVLDALPPNDDNRASIEQIIKAGGRAADLTRQLLSFSRRQVARPRTIDLNEVVAATAVMLRRLIGRHIELRIVAGPGAAKIHADPGQIEQVIMNLAVNARDAMPQGGTLLLETHQASRKHRPSQSLKPGRYFVLGVTDTGTGMSAQTRSHLFEPFFTTKAQGQGTGLGLSTVYSIVKQSGGEIAVDSEEGRGTSVKIYFPEVGDEIAPQGREDRGSGLPTGTETILLVEDEEPVRRLVAQLLSKQGYEVLTAARGTEALQAAQHHAGLIHLLITDLEMPEMTGYRLARQLKASRPHLRVLYISGHSEGGLPHQESNARASGWFLQKPFDPPVLVRRVREALDSINGKPSPSKTEWGCA